MKKWLITIIFVFASIMFVYPVSVNAIGTNSITNTIGENTYVLTNSDILEEDCSGSNSIFGDPNDENSVAWMIQLVLDVIKVVGPILVIILSSIDFLKVIIKSDDDAMAKAQKKLIIRLILALLLFLIPVIVQVLLGVFGITSDPTCGLH